MNGFVDEIKTIFNERTIEGLGYATISGLASATLGALLGKATKNQYAQYLGYIIGGAGMAYVADKLLNRPNLRGFAIFGAIFPPVYGWVTQKINPEELANKTAMALGLNWEKGATHALAVYEIPSTTRLSQISNPQPASPTAVSNISY